METTMSDCINQQKKAPSYLRIKLEGPKNNPQALGAKVWAKWGKGKMAYQEMASIVSDVKQADNLNDRLRYVFAGPGWEPEAAA